MNKKFVYSVQIFHKELWTWRMYECEAVNEKQAYKLASLDNPNWIVRYARKKVN